MPNMSLKKVPMPEQEPNVRNHNFQEVSLGYTKEMAMEEAARCLNCKHKPCVGGCPVNIRIPEFIAKVAEGDFQAAYDIISDTNALPSVSGRVCPQESQCEARCVRAIKGEPVAIGRLERFVADWYRENVNAMPQKPQTNGIKTIVSLNPIMIDGTGMCGGCRVTVGGKMKFACVDGPDFDGHEVDFDELMNRNSVYRAQEAEEKERHACRMDQLAHELMDH